MFDRKKIEQQVLASGKNAAIAADGTVGELESREDTGHHPSLAATCIVSYKLNGIPMLAFPKENIFALIKMDIAKDDGSHSPEYRWIQWIIEVSAPTEPPHGT